MNGVPVCLYFATVAYFITYHTLTTIGLRRWWTGHTYARLPAWARGASTCVLVVGMAWFTAFMEAFTISGFPYYAIQDRTFLYTVGSVVYGLYFVVSFPAFARLDEEEGKLGGAVAPASYWTAGQTAIDSLGACMLVTLLLEAWRLGVTAARAGDGGGGLAGLPWLLR